MSDVFSSRPWLAQYASYTSDVLPEERYANLAEFVLSLRERYGELPAFSNYGRSFSFAEVVERAKRFAGFLQAGLGFEKGDRLAIMMPNLLQYPIALYGAFLAGAVVVNVNPLYTAHELLHQLRDSGARAILVVESYAAVVEKVRHKAPDLKQVIVTKFGDEQGMLKGMAMNFVVRHLRRLHGTYDKRGILFYRDVFKKDWPWHMPDVSLQDVAMLQYTSGTTGKAKGVMLSHGNLLANVRQVQAWVGVRIAKPGLLSISPLPVYHVFACTVNMLSFPDLGMHTLLVTDPRDISGFVRLLRRHSFSVFTGVNTLFRALLRHPSFKKIDFSKNEFTITGGMSLQKDVFDAWLQLTGKGIIEGYGLTETSPVVSCNLLDTRSFSGGIGYPFPSTEVRLCDKNDRLVAIGERGELCVRGPQVMLGYWQNQKATDAVLSEDGWLKTGDIAVMDASGFLQVVDRKKNMILVSGFNVYPREVEAVILKHPKVAECAVKGVDIGDGERVQAYVVLKSGAELSEKDLRAFVAEYLTNYKRPKVYVFLSTLPKSPIGKVLYHELPKG